MAASSGSSIGRGTVIRGSIRGDGDLDIDGRVEGTIDVDGDIALSESARVRIEDGALVGRSVSVRGAVAGSIRGSASVVLEAGARVVGDLNAPSIGIRAGGLLRGYVSTNDDGASQAPTRARAQRAPARAESASRAQSPRVAPPRASTPRTQRAPEPEPTPAPRASKKEGAPAPVMPALKKGQKGQMKKKGAH